MGLRLGGPVFLSSDDPRELAREHVRLGYRAAYCPPAAMLAQDADIARVREAYAAEDVVIAEVGAWCNPLDPDAQKAAAARENIAQRLALAEELGARCCVNIIGSFNPDNWAGCHPGLYGDAFFDQAVEVYQGIIDRVKPARTAMTFETMPYYFLDGPEEYLRFLAAINRQGAGVHIDMCNCVSSPRAYYDNAALTRRTFKMLGGLIRSCHLKDLTLCDKGSTAKFYETPLGTGGFDVAEVLRCASRLDDCPVMLEHLPDEATYDAARSHAQKIMGENDLNG